MEKYAEIIASAVKQLFDVDAEVKLTRPDPKFGDYATNVALTIAGKVGENPRAVAEKIAAELGDLSSSDLIRRSSDEEADKGDEPLQNNEDSAASLGMTNSTNKIFDSVDIAGPGFINLKISAKHLATQLESLNQEIAPENGVFAGQVVVTEYSDANPFKVLHIGHLYTSVVGDAISNLIEASGGTAYRVNFGGDVGLHVAKVMWAILKNIGGEKPEKLADIPETERADWISKLYVEGNTAYGQDDESKLEIIAINKRLYQVTGDGDHESDFAKIYWTCRQWSYDYFEDFYAKIGVKFDKYYPESETAALGMETIRQHPEVYTKSNGAIIFDGEKFGLHARVFVNSEGLPTYETKDMGCTLQKYADYHFDKQIIITGNDIIEYMKVVLKSIEQFAPKIALSTEHFTHGIVKLPGGVKQSSRLGNAIKAVDVLDLVTEAQEKEQGNRAMVTILGAIKYAFLRNRIGPDVVFEPETSVSLAGTSGPYVQYAAVRVNKILRDNAAAINPNNLREEKRVCTGSFIFSRDDKILLGWNRKGGVYEDCLIVPGGGVDPGETEIQAMIRETREEVGLDVSNQKIEKIGEDEGGTEKTDRQTGERIWADMKFVDYAIYYDETAAEISDEAQPGEFSETKWFSREELLDLKLSPPTERMLRKIGWLPPENYDYAAEKTLILKLLEYPEILRAAAHEFEPHRIATYVYELARELNRYYETTPVATAAVPDEIKAARLKLLQKISAVFKHGLGILGIEIPEKM